MTVFWSRFERGDGEGNPQLDQVAYLYRQPPSMQSLLSLCQATASKRQTELSAGFPPTAADCPHPPFQLAVLPSTGGCLCILMPFISQLAANACSLFETFRNW